MLTDLEIEIAQEFCRYCHMYQPMEVVYDNAVRNYKAAKLLEFPGETEGARNAERDLAFANGCMTAIQALIHSFRQEPEGTGLRRRLINQGKIRGDIQGRPPAEIPFDVSLMADLLTNFMLHVRNKSNT